MLGTFGKAISRVAEKNFASSATPATQCGTRIKSENKMWLADTAARIAVAPENPD
jgi:hypothetical protein